MILIILLALNMFGSTFANEPVNLDGRIVGGNPINNMSDVPFQISLRIADYHICGGSILNENTIITAAHCMNPLVPDSNYSIRAGSISQSTGGQVITVDKVIMNTLYNSTTMDYDSCILKLKSNLNFSDDVAKVNLPIPGLNISEGTLAFVSGWGALIFQGASPDQLQRVEVPVVSNEKCAKVYGYIGQRQLCAGEKDYDSCQGDSGGPLVVNNELVGLVSWGYACALDGYPTIYTRVSEIIPWILQNL